MDSEKYYRERAKAPRMLVGIILLAVGALLIAKQTGAYIPSWLLSWQMILVVIGLVIGIKNRFNGVGWLIPMLIGGFFMMDDFFPTLALKRFIAPAVVIVVGLTFIFRDKRKCVQRKYPFLKYNGDPETGSVDEGDIIDENVVFGNIKKNIISKNFKGGEINSVFGSAEINLLKAEITDIAKLEVNTVFGSARIIMPSHWQLKLENNSILGGIEDKRPETLVPSDKILMLEANAVFGGIEIRSY